MTGPTKLKGRLDWFVLTGQTPCQTCQLHDYCAAAYAACDDWNTYIETGVVMETNRTPKAGAA